jgi:hypothetical protein
LTPPGRMAWAAARCLDDEFMPVEGRLYFMRKDQVPGARGAAGRIFCILS